jgi:hypothetical protein
VHCPHKARLADMTFLGRPASMLLSGPRSMHLTTAVTRHVRVPRTTTLPGQLVWYTPRAHTRRWQHSQLRMLHSVGLLLLSLL